MPQRRRCVIRFARVVILGLPHDSTQRRNGRARILRFAAILLKDSISVDHGAIKRMTKTCPAMLAAKRGVNWSGRHASSALKMDSVSA
jgi:hypothetical protein